MDVKSGKANLFIKAQQATSSEDKITVEASTTAQPSQVVAEKKAPAKTKTGAHGEFQISTSATQAKLRTQLANTERGGQIRDNNLSTPPWVAERNLWNALQQKHLIPKTLSTGSGNDRVNIFSGPDGRVRVTVNDKEAWSGTQEEFQHLTIDTGDGDDVVNNNVSGANIFTGKGKDTVVNRGSDSNINTGEGDDKVINTNTRVVYSWFRYITVRDTSQAKNNTIDTGEGNDQVDNEGSQNIIRTGSGNDIVKTTFGISNKINTGAGEDELSQDGWSATFNQVYDPDKK